MGDVKLTKVRDTGSTLLVQAHRRWIETRDPKDGDNFSKLVLALASSGKDE